MIAVLGELFCRVWTGLSTSQIRCCAITNRFQNLITVILLFLNRTQMFPVTLLRACSNDSSQAIIILRFCPPFYNHYNIIFVPTSFFYVALHFSVTYYSDQDLFRYQPWWGVVCESALKDVYIDLFFSSKFSVRAWCQRNDLSQKHWR